MYKKSKIDFYFKEVLISLDTKYFCDYKTYICTYHNHGLNNSRNFRVIKQTVFNTNIF